MVPSASPAARRVARGCHAKALTCADFAFTLGDRMTRLGRGDDGACWIFSTTTELPEAKANRRFLNTVPVRASDECGRLRKFRLSANGTKPEPGGFAFSFAVDMTLSITRADTMPRAYTPQFQRESNAKIGISFGLHAVITA